MVRRNSAGFPTMAGLFRTFYQNSENEVIVSTTTHTGSNKDVEKLFGSLLNIGCFNEDSGRGEKMGYRPRS